MLVVTCTHGRPKALEYLAKWVSKQTFTAFQWLIVCDDWEDYKFPKGKNIKVVKRDPSDDKLPSICENWLEALKHVGDHDKIVCLEDDDWYCDSYLYEIDKLLEKAELVGFNEDAYYYVLERRPKRVHNVEHASLAASGFRASVLPYFKQCVEKGELFIDLLLWKGWDETILVPQPPMETPDGRTITPPPVENKLKMAFKGKRLLCDNFTGIIKGSRQLPKLDNEGNVLNEYPRHVGMKQPWHGGAEGLSEWGHKAQGGLDQQGFTLQKWIGDDAQDYLKFTVPPKVGTANLFMHIPDTDR